MLGNFIRTAWRNLRRDKVYAIINIGGLSLGLAVCLVATLWLLQETSYDRFHPEGDRLYRVSERISRTDGFRRDRASSGMPLAPIAMREVAGVEQVCRITRQSSVVAVNQQAVRRNVYAADANFFSLFGFSLAYGDARTALADPSGIILSRRAAINYFGRPDALGERITWNHREMTVSGILAESDQRSHIQPELLVPMSALELLWPDWSDHWDAYVFTYLRLNPGVDPTEFAPRLAEVAMKHLHEPGTSLAYELMPVSQLHVHSPLLELTPTVGSGTLIMYGLAAAIILVLACSNFVTLSIARSTRRRREVGMRKVLGGTRREIVLQFIIESLVLTAISLIVALSIVELAAPQIGRFLQSTFEPHLSSPIVWFIFLAYLLIIGVAAGLYPALYLARTGAKTSFRSEAPVSRVSFGRRGALIVIQFAATGLLLMLAVSGHRQMSMLLHADLGFDAQNILVLPIAETSAARQTTLKRELSRLTGISRIGAASCILGGTDCYGLTYSVPGKVEQHSLPTFWVDEQFASVVGLQSTSGEPIETSTATCAFATSPAVKVLADGSATPTLIHIQAARGKDAREVPLIQIGDINPRNLYYGASQPLVFVVDSQYCEYLYLRTSAAPTAAKQVISDIAGVWTRVNPDLPFEPFWLSDRIQSGYSNDQRFTWSLTYSALLAVLVSCIGLIGLTAYLTAERTKEIGIRRVLGASERHIVWHFARRFALLVAIAITIAFPVAFYLTERWLMQFPVRVEPSFLSFLLIALMLLATALLSITIQARQAARRNAVDTLCYE